jgi:hypothetical protein
VEFLGIYRLRDGAARCAEVMPTFVKRSKVPVCRSPGHDASEFVSNAARDRAARLTLSRSCAAAASAFPAVVAVDGRATSVSPLMATSIGPDIGHSS